MAYGKLVLMLILLISFISCAHRGGKHHFSKFDGNNDGKITKAEMREHTDKKFKKWDKNNDGVITKDEWKKDCKKKCKKCSKSECSDKKCELKNKKKDK